MAAKAPFKVWSFFFSTRGRVSRVPFALFQVPVAASLLCLHLVVIPFTRETSGIFSQGSMIVMGVTGIADLAMTWPRYAITVKRLHDADMSWWIGLPILAPFAFGLIFGVATYLDSSSGFVSQYASWQGWNLTGFGVSAVFHSLLLGLCFLPGTKGSNRFGPLPGQTAKTLQDVF